MDRLVKTLTSAKNIISFAASGDRAIVGLETGDDGLDVWDLGTGDLHRHLTWPHSNGDGARSVALDPAGRVAAACGLDAEVVSWNAETGAAVKLIPPPGAGSDNAGRVAVSPDGQVILSAYLGWLTLFDTALSQKLRFRTFDGGGTTLFGAAFEPGGARAALGYARSDGGSDIKVFDLVSGQATLNITAHRGSGVNCLAWFGGGILAGSGDKTLSLTRATDGALIRSFTGSTGSVLSVAVAAGGRLAASGSGDATIALWDVTTGAQLATIKQVNAVSGVAFTGDGKSVVSSDGHTVKVWDVSDLSR